MQTVGHNVYLRMLLTREEIVQHFEQENAMYGKELILDMHDCDPTRFTKLRIEAFMITLCEKIDMEREVLHFWVIDNPEQPDHLIGTSACQFIRTSNVVIHTLDKMRRVYLNIFSCKDFDQETAKAVCLNFFRGYIKNQTVVDRT